MLLAGRLLARLPLVYATYRVAQFLVFLQANQVKKKKKTKEEKRHTQSHTHTHGRRYLGKYRERERNRKPARCVRHCLFELFFFSVIKNKMFFLASLERQDTSVDTYVLEFLIDSVGEIAFRYRNSHKQQQLLLLLIKPERKEKKKKLWQKLNLKRSK